jgi:uncharacterized protein (DUF433 family)
MAESTLRTWLFGQSYGTASGRRASRPLIMLAGDEPPRLSFINMVEAHVLSAIRYHHGVQLPAVRRALEYLTQEFGSRHPLAEEQFETDGVNLFVKRLDVLLNVSSPGQFAMREILQALLKRVERDERGLAVRLYPFSRRPVVDRNGAAVAFADSPRSVMIDPRVSFGRPVLAGTGITTLTIAERFDAGESIEELAADYGRSRGEIEEAIRCELTRDAA